jgi:hypothetical protein
MWIGPDETSDPMCYIPRFGVSEAGARHNEFIVYSVHILPTVMYNSQYDCNPTVTKLPQGSAPGMNGRSSWGDEKPEESFGDYCRREVPTEAM